MDRQALLGLNHFKTLNDIIIFESPSITKANEVTFEILEKFLDFKTALFLSGGSTPKKLYELIATKKNLRAGAVGQIDERFGRRGHRNSNELMIEESGLVSYFESQNIRFYPILEDESNIQECAKNYDEALRFIFKYIPKNVGILGVGQDGHTAGIPSGIQKSNIKNQKLIEINKRILNDQGSFITNYDDESGIYGQRITMTYTGLSQLDLVLILAFGKEKREVLSRMFKNSVESTQNIKGKTISELTIEEYPVMFYLRPELAKKTILITDQIV